MKILMISSTFPYPPSLGGTEIRTFNLLKYLKHDHSVTLVTQSSTPVPLTTQAELKQYLDELVIFPFGKNRTSHSWFSKIIRFLNCLIKGKPPNVLYRYHPMMQNWIDSHVYAGNFDVITCEHSVNEMYIKSDYSEFVVTVVNIHSSVYGWIKNHLEIGASPYPMRDRLYLYLLLKRYEKSYCQKFDRLVVTTADDKDQLMKFCPQIPIDIIPNGVDLDLFPYRTSDPGGYRLIFVGALDASHNIDAVRFFTGEILPKVQQKYPQASLTIVGARPVREVIALTKHSGIELVANAKEIAPYYHQSTVCVVPLRSGYGIKNKTLEAMATGIPVVGSDRGLEGIEETAPTPAAMTNQTPTALRANHIDEYVSAISQLFDEPLLRQQLSKKARLLIETVYTWEKQGQNYAKVLKNEQSSKLD